jgi:hypothetical protein
MTARFQAIATIVIGCSLVVLGGWWAITIACCSGRPRETALAFAALGLAIVILGAWSLQGLADKSGIVRRNSLWTTLVLLAVATGVLAHAVLGVHRERTLAMRWQESAAYLGNESGRGFVVLSYESNPEYYLRVDDEKLASYLRGLPDHRVQATFDATTVFGSVRTMRLMKVGDLSSAVGFGTTSGTRGLPSASPPWK